MEETDHDSPSFSLFGMSLLASFTIPANLEANENTYIPVDHLTPATLEFKSGSKGTGLEGYVEFCGNLAKDQFVKFFNEKAGIRYEGVLSKNAQTCMALGEAGEPRHIDGTVFRSGTFSFFDADLPMAGIAYLLPDGEVYATFTQKPFNITLKSGETRECQSFTNRGAGNHKDHWPLPLERRVTACGIGEGEFGCEFSWDQVMSVQLID